MTEIRATDGVASASAASVTDEVAIGTMVEETMGRWGRIDILVNNAGILRDKSFAKMALDDFQLVMDVHVMGAVICTTAVWEVMRTQRYGRTVMTTSSYGLYGNFGQANCLSCKTLSDNSAELRPRSRARLAKASKGATRLQPAPA